MTSSTGQEQQGTLELQQEKKGAGPVECLGLTFENDQARRDHFLALLKEKLQDTEFRKIPGFPQGSDEAILRMSDPPYYTACPNPFLEDFVRCYGKTYVADEVYEREPFAVDVSVGKTDQLYKAHGYHTKVPHLAIVPSILHYTKPGDIVLDGFSGSGMTGVACEWCDAAPLEYIRELELDWGSDDNSPPHWGARKVVLNDLSPAATRIAAGFLSHADISSFEKTAESILTEAEEKLGWMFETLNRQTGATVRLDMAVWSEVFTCSNCGGDIVFLDAALNESTGEVDKELTCPSCGVCDTKEHMDLQFESVYDAFRKAVVQRPKRTLSLVRYKEGRSIKTLKPIDTDLELAAKVASMPMPAEAPYDDFPDCQMGRVGRMKTTGVSNLGDLLFPREAHVISYLWRRVFDVQHLSLRSLLLFWVDSQIVNLSIQNRYRPGVSFPYNPLNGVYYVSSVIAEADPFKAYRNKIRRISSGFSKFSKPSRRKAFDSIVSTGDCGRLLLSDNCIDYIFTDPPFGENIYYGDLNYQVEAWYRVFTSIPQEAIVDRVRNKDAVGYQRLMQGCFSEYFRVLKPGRWVTIVFSNASNAIWRAIQEAIGNAGFVIADVRTLDKKQGSFKQVTSSAVKQDLVISAYKPSEDLQRQFQLGLTTVNAAWSFVREHLGNVPVFVGRSSEVEIIAERTSQMLLDRMIAFHVQHGFSVPLSGAEFLQGLTQRFPERDGMYFLPDQVTEYDRKRTTATQLRQLSFFVNDEHSAIQWIRQQLQDKPQSFQDLQPQFMRELQAWAKHEQTVELKVILEQNFLHYDGRGPVPSQIHSYLSTNFKDLRNLDKEDPKLIEKARDRWYVPDPNKQADLDQIRERALLKEFEDIKESSQRRIKQFRTEAVRAGFKACWQERDYATIVKVAAKLPEAVLQEDEKLLMYIDNAQTRLGDDA